MFGYVSKWREKSKICNAAFLWKLLNFHFHMSLPQKKKKRAWTGCQIHLSLQDQDWGKTGFYLYMSKSHLGASGTWQTWQTVMLFSECHFGRNPCGIGSPAKWMWCSGHLSRHRKACCPLSPWLTFCEAKAVLHSLQQTMDFPKRCLLPCWPRAGVPTREICCALTIERWGQE